MKKTFSLKLMLLGLLLSVSSGVWAQYIAKDGIIYQINSAKKQATVVGVNKKAASTKAITIPDKVEGNTVVAIASDWVKPTGKIFQNTSGGTGTTGQVPTGPASDEGVSSTTETGTGSQTIVTFAWIDAKTIENLTLTFDASQIKKIDNNLVLDIQSLQVENFVIGANSAITVIPEQLFASSTAGEPIITWSYYGSDETTTGEEPDAEKKAAAEETLNQAKRDKNTEISDLQDALEEAQDDKVDADAAVEAAEDALRIAEMIEEHPELMNTPELTKKQQAERLEAAIAAFKDFKTGGGAGYDDLLVPKVQEYTNVTNVSTWFVAYTLATEGVDIVGFNNASNKAALQALVEEVKAAYAEFYGKDLTPQTLQEIKAFEFTSYDVPAPSNDNFDPTNPGYIGNATYTSWASGLVKVGEEKTFGEKTATEVTVLTNEGADGETVPGFVDQKFFILATVGTEDAPGYSKDNYYFLFTEDENDGLAPVTSGDATALSYIAVKIGEKKDLSLNDNTEAEILIDAADPAGDIAEAKDGVQSVDDATEALEKAQENQAAAEQAVTNAQNALTTAQGELTALNNTAAVTSESEPTLIVDLEAENETLKSVAFENDKIETIEAFAFYNCVEAEFTGTFPATLQAIEEKAFANTQFKNLDLSNTGTIDWRGAEDEEGNIIPDGVVDELDKLGDEDIADDAFAGTPLETMLLAPTLLTSEWVKTVAQGLVKAEDPIEVEWCDAAEPVKVKALNTTLTTAVLPDYEEFTEIADKTFFKNWALTSVTIPASVVTIGKQAFQYTNVPEFDLTNLEGLATIGAAAFSRNPSLTSVK
ncbi:MAG: leucine-rich repeat protein, partial [Bacteroidaceae bacterium]|nr:leucine-rich repeat protein [Bacteroidaceae bacterium]